MLLGTAPGCRDDGGPEPAGQTDGDETSGSDEGVDETTGEDVVDDALYLSDTEHLIRISMALRGRRPSPEDLDAVEADPAALEDIVDRYLDDPAMAEMIRDLHNDVLLQDAEIFELPGVDELAGEDPEQLAKEVLLSPLMLAEHIVMNDRPYTELVTADYWMVTERGATVWGASYDASGPYWQVVPIPDDRGAAGILADNAFFMRHLSNGFNLNRGRANVVTRALLCHDFLESDINVSGGIDLSDPESVADAALEVPACVSCHQTLDPLASALNGYLEPFEPEELTSYPVEGFYQPELLGVWEELNGRPPNYFGTPIDDLADLGQSIADDPRFSLCTAQRFYSYLMQTKLDDVPLSAASQLQDVLVDTGYDTKALIREIVMSDDFRRIDDPAADPELWRGYLRARPYQLSSLVEDLTGFHWYFAAGDQALSLPHQSVFGFEVLAGGHDSFFTTQASTTVDITTSLFLRRLGMEAAAHVVDVDLAAEPAARRLLTEVSANDTDPANVRAQLVGLFRRIYGETVSADDPGLEDAYAIWSAVHEDSGDVSLAWKTTIAALLQDLHVVYY